MTDNSEQQTSTTPTKPKKGFFGYAWRTILWFLVILYFALGAAWLGARYCLAPYLNDHKSKIENKISQVLDIPVQFGSLDTDWQGLSPEITLKNIELGEPGKDPITAESLTAKLSLSSLTNLTPIFESVTLNNPKVEVRRLAPMSFSVLGRKVNLKKLMSGETETQALTTKLPSDVMVLLKQKSVEIKDGTILVHDQKSGKTLEVTNVNVGYNGSSRNKQLAFTLTLPPEIASPITVRALFKTPALNPSKLADWDAELYAQTDFINFGELAKWLPDFSVKYKGTGSGSLWANFVKWSPSSASFIGALSHVDLQLPELAPLRLKFVKGKISGNMSGEAYALSTDNFSFELESGETLPPLDMSLKLDRSDDNFTGGSFKANALDFQGLTAVLPSLPLPKSFKDFVAERKLSGSLVNVDLDWQGLPSEPKHYNGKLSLRNFSSFGASGKDNTQWLPGFINLSADITLKDGVGTTVLTTKDASVALPRLFPAAAFHFDSIGGTVVWNTVNGISLEFKDVLIENADAAVKVNGTYTNADNTPLGTADLKADVLRGNVPAVWKYMPLVVGNDTITWLRYGLLEGKATGGQAVLKGPLHEFPFHESKEHHFLVSVNAEDVLLDVYPNILDNPKASPKRGAIWPLFEKVGGVVKFEGDGMAITADRGTYKGVQLTHAQVDIPAFSADTVWLDVDAAASGALPGFLSYVKTSPVDGYTSGLFKKAKGTGNGDLTLKLKIPLDGPGEVAVSGAFTLKDNAVKFNDFSIPDLTHATGVVNFNDKGASSTGITADCFGNAVKATLDTDDKGNIKVSASGTIAAKALPQVIPVPMLAKAADKYLSGKTPFTVNVTVGPKVTVNVKSSLSGLESKLPPPMEKPASLSAPLDLNIVTDNKATDLRIMIEGFLSSEFILQNNDIKRAAIGNRSLPTLPSHGYAISLKAPLVSAKAWQAVFDHLKVDTKPSGTVVLPDIAFLKANIDELLIDNFNQTNFSLLGRPVGNSLLITINSNQMNANLEWKKAQNGKEPELIAHISKLFIQSSARDAAEKSKPVQIQGGWPAINAVIDDLTYGNMRLGKLELVARNTPSTKGQLWKITKLNLSNSAAQLRSSGSWLKGFDGGNETNLLINTNINNLGGLLNRLDMQNLVKSGNGSINGNLSWVGTPLGFNTESFDGELNIDLKRGEILKIQPGPAAKLLSLLTLQSLTRYLTLDFRDFYSSGFNFSTIRGKAVLEDDLMNINDLTMIGGSATVVINGNVNTQKETENLHLLVLPDINAAGASVALAVANPIVGIGSFLAQLIFKDPLSKLFSFEYQVTGTWSDPVVTKIKR